jgi:hypothetical protein
MAEGSFTEDEAVMASMTTEFYRSLYMAEGTADTDQLLDTVSTKLTGEMNDLLLKLIGLGEVKNAACSKCFRLKLLARTVFQRIFSETLGPLWQ